MKFETARPVQATPVERDPFDEWVTPHVRRLAAVAAALALPHEVDDLLQETLLRAWQKWNTYDYERGSPRAWLVAILFDQARKLRRRRSPLVHPPTLQDQYIAPDPDGRLVIEHAIQRLSRRQKEAVYLYYLADLPIAEVARVMRVSDGSVKAHLHHARNNLRSALEDQQ